MAAPWPHRVVASLGLAVAVGLALRLALCTGTIVSDDLTHAWAAQHLWDDPVEPGMPTAADSPYTVNARRVGVNLPMWVAFEVAGPSEASLVAAPLVMSLLGILAVAAWAWALAGPRAAAIAGWLWAVLPVDVWHATVALQDNAFATVLAAGMAALAWAERGRGRAAWIAAGLALGYLQYVKESAAVLLAVVVVAGVVRSWRAGAVHRGTLWLLAGAAVVHALAVGYFAIATGDAAHYVRAWLERQVEVEAEVAPRPFPGNLVRLGLYLTWGGALGVGLLPSLVLGVRWLRRGGGEAPRAARIALVVLAVVQLAIVVHVLRWGAWTMRYLLQLTPALIALGAVGLATSWTAVSARARTAFVVAAIATTALGLGFGHPQHGRDRAAPVREALAAIARDVPGDVPVYVVTHPSRPAHYTDRAMALLADAPRPGGWLVTRDPASIARGVLVWASYERHAAPPVAPPGRRIAVASAMGGRVWIEVRAVGL